ncbi:hypothetical protein PIB30_038239 [Stylosanthes scabra]|uniref:Uncharacterized protein n=1 Tax=Stylosanthes scabra TaxID=79078 RepID=A0ABU6UCM0_9FABA|nr:hypothetical protein [Stylosanthes scabra]
MFVETKGGQELTNESESDMWQCGLTNKKLRYDESVFHCIWECPESIAAWRLAELPLPRLIAEPWKWWLELLSIFKNGINGQNKLELATALIWSIWKAHNELIFEDTERTPSMLLPSLFSKCTKQDELFLSFVPY